ncbi:tetratricopeptide repeat protein, partial [Bacteroidota bacterium]
MITDLYSQTIQESREHAENQFQAGNYHNSIAAYRRILFFEPYQHDSEIYSNLSLCYFNMNDYNKSHYYNQLAYSVESNDSIKTEIGLQNVFMYILQKEFNYALSELFSLPVTESEYLTKKYNFYKGVIYFHQNK